MIVRNDDDLAGSPHNLALAHITDQAIVALMRRIGIVAGQSFDIDKTDPMVKQALVTAPEDAQKLMDWTVKTIAREKGPTPAGGFAAAAEGSMQGACRSAASLCLVSKTPAS